MIVFAEHTTPRLNYVLNQILKEQLGIVFSLTNDFEVFCLAKTPKINYSTQTATNGLQIIPEGLLFEDEIRKTKPEFLYADDFPIIFKQENGDLIFDIFSAVFWFLSRYEEYQEFNPDSHNRFPATECFAFKNDILNHPIVDEWLAYFRTQLKSQFPDIKLKMNAFSAITTIDVDSPWCYKNKGFLRNLAGLVRDVLKNNFSDVLLRIKVLVNVIPDPWYNFKWIMNVTENKGADLLFFIHVGNYGKYDKTVSYSSKAFINFINDTIGKVSIGLHPSYNAAHNKKVFQNELMRLTHISKKEIKSSRQHFLVFTTAHYYSQLIDLGIEDDYSMGFADKPGFRAGTSNPFYFFDLHKNEETNLLIHPFAIMDRTLNSYEGQSVEKALETVKSLIENVKKVNGTFVSLWHNESLSDMHEWKGWQYVFQETSEYLASK